jgi:magnesium-transporting ATPase (P-type)
MHDYKGLSEHEVQISKESGGTNALNRARSETFWDKYFGNFKDPIIIILMVALGINLIFVLIGKAEWFEALGIFKAKIFPFKQAIEISSVIMCCASISIALSSEILSFIFLC